MRSLVAGFIWVTVLLAAGAPARAQEVCQAGDSLERCRDRLSGMIIEEVASERASALARLVEGAVAGNTAGFGTSAGGGLGSSLEDFLPLFGGRASLSEGAEQRQGFGFDLNLPTDSPERFGILRLGGTLRLSVRTLEPLPLDTLVALVDLERREAFRGLLADSLGEIDDVEIGIVWNRESSRYGRSAAWHRELLDDLLYAAATAEDPDWGLDEFREEIAEDTARFLDPGRPAELRCEVLEVFVAEMACFTPTTQETLAAHMRARARREARVGDAVRSSGFFRLADLINNQPQLMLSVRARVRDPFVGPNGMIASIRWERGSANVNDLRRHCGSTGVRPACLSSFLAKEGVVPSLRRGSRLFLSANLEWLDDYSVQVPFLAATVRLEMDEAWAGRLDLGYGQYLSVNEEGEETARLDGEISYRVAENGTGRSDRFVASVTYTQKVSDQISLPVGVVYANRPEFLGGVDDRIGLNLGVTYRLVQRDPD